MCGAGCARTGRKGGGSLRVCGAESRWRRSDLTPSGVRRAGWTGSREPGVLFRPCARPRLPVRAVRGGSSGNSRDLVSVRGFVRGRCCGLWCPQSVLSREGHPFSPECFRCLGSRVSNPGPFPLSLALPGGSNKSLNFHIALGLPKRQLLIHSIINYESPWRISEINNEITDSILLHSIC